MKKRNYPKKRRQYDEEFKQNALEMIANGRSVTSVSQALGVSEGLLYNWKSKSKTKTTATSSETQDELKQLRKQLAEVEMERDILKKALGIFSRPIW